MASNSDKFTDAVAYYRTGRLSDAIAAFSEVMDVEPENADAASNLAVLYTSIGEFVQAEIFFRRALEIAPEDPEP